MSNISINQNWINDYLIDFHPLKKEEILKIIEKENFDRAPKSFIGQIKRIISMPKIGKSTIRYWISRGWSEEDSKLKRKIVKRDPKKSPMNIEFWINKGFTKEQSEFEVKSQRKLNKEYWIKRGFSLDESIIKCSEFQKSNSKKYLEKLNSNIEFKERVDRKRTNNINYWLDKGYNKEDSIKKVSERQSTFSLKKCIDTHGELLGTEIWKNRQEKWKNSLSISSYNLKDRKDSKSISHFKSKYGNDWVEKYILNQSFVEKDDIRYLISFTNYQNMIINLIGSNFKLGDIHYRIKYEIVKDVYSCALSDMYSFLIENFENDYNKPSYYKRAYGNDWVERFIEKNTYKDKDDVRLLLSFKSYRDLVDYLIGNYSITNTVLKLQNVIVSSYYETTYEEIFNYMMSSNPYMNGKFGYMRYFNNHLCRSSGEFEISKFLQSNNISYSYEKKYPNSNKRCDFYLTNIDMYIEYLGMSSTLKFREKYNEKEKFCIDQKINHFFSDKIEDIKNKVTELYEI